MAARKEAPPGSADDAKGAPASLWERLDRPAPAPRATLTAQRIATVGVAIADAEGLEAITMRRLATELGVAPMAAYRYVSGKDDLLELMVDLVHGELELPDPAVGWRETLRTIALRTRALLFAHPWLARLNSPQAMLALTPNRLAVSECALAAMAGLGLDVDTTQALARSVDLYTRGATHSEIVIQQLMASQGWNDGDELRVGLGSQMSWLMGTGRYPVLERHLVAAVRKDDPDWQFEVGLDCVLDGIAARLPG
ncbi:TetR/AcrR family transcriptional regulator [Kitasatospora kifunensis]|uniref:AcrR family transcriptional regulator n=1 Tax=Kitasatospora kifunensis TaxID=58351 RepID=A0A7W7R3C9_KITKI|nr:TetR/AcrR family transcriptional regulator [Kitasatospora kifunensis]MBB4924708.1 AcrR family transcriptional regulator [Kitasatospora kifunensis]